MKLLTNLLPESIAEDITFAWGEFSDTHSASVLKEKERKQYQSYRHAYRRREYLATRTLIAKMVESMGLKYSAFRLQKDILGRPYGTYNKQQFYVSIAHSRGKVLSAISLTRPVGIDIEPVDRKVPEALRNRMLNETEAPLLQQETTLRIWTLKEALVKLQGNGMRTNFDEWTIKPASGNQFIAKFNNDKSARICSFSHEKNWLAIAWPGNKISPQNFYE